MSLCDPRNDEGRDAADCYVIVVRNFSGMWRPYGVAIGETARDSMLAFVSEVNPEREFKAINLEGEQE